MYWKSTTKGFSLIQGHIEYECNKKLLTVNSAGEGILNTKLPVLCLRPMPFKVINKVKNRAGKQIPKENVDKEKAPGKIYCWRGGMVWPNHEASFWIEAKWKAE